MEPDSSLPTFTNPDRPLKRFSGVMVTDTAVRSILLGMKRRGFGTGKWQHSFCGKVEPGETEEEAARRELREESGLNCPVGQLRPLGTFYYEFVNEEDLSFNMKVTIFHAERGQVEGEVAESPEVEPKWFSMGEVPFDQMWMDNQYWLPGCLERLEKGEKVEHFLATFLYENHESIKSFQFQLCDHKAQ